MVVLIIFIFNPTVGEMIQFDLRIFFIPILKSSLFGHFLSRVGWNISNLQAMEGLCSEEWEEKMRFNRSMKGGPKQLGCTQAARKHPWYPTFSILFW